MLLIPYFWDTSNPNWTSLGLFLCSGGDACWSVDVTDTDIQIKSMLSENGFPVTSIIRNNNRGVIYAEIDRSKLNLADFYLWSELDSLTTDTDVWRILRIPNALHSCPVFTEQFWSHARLPFDSAIISGLRP
jgi:hypothetical protein